MTPATILEHDGIKQPIKEWALDYGITPAIIMGRIERGQTIADAITTPMKIGFRGQKLASRDMEAFIRGKRIVGSASDVRFFPPAGGQRSSARAARSSC